MKAKYDTTSQRLRVEIIRRRRGLGRSDDERETAAFVPARSGYLYRGARALASRNEEKGRALGEARRIEESERERERKKVAVPALRSIR